MVPLDLSIADWRDAAGERFFTIIMRDISARKATEARQDILVREVDHRAKNILAVVQSVLRLTPRDQPGAFAAAETRIAGLARVHSLLAEGGWSGADLRAVVERELAAYSAVRGDRNSPAVSLDGPTGRARPDCGAAACHGAARVGHQCSEARGALRPWRAGRGALDCRPQEGGGWTPAPALG